MSGAGAADDDGDDDVEVEDEGDDSDDFSSDNFTLTKFFSGLCFLY